MHNYYSVADFRQKLFIEKRRVERLDLKTSVSIFKFTHLISRLNSVLKDNRIIEIFLQLVCKNVRKTDVVCLYDAETVVVLLPETNSNGAQMMTERVVKKITEDLEKTFGIADVNENDIEIDILSYPEKANQDDADRALPEANLPAINPEILPVTSTSPVQTIKFKQEFFMTNNLSFSTNNGATIASPFCDVFFWDQELIISASKLIKKFVKRAMDLLGSAILLILLSPLMMLISILIKLTSRGKVIFKQKRIGYKGKFFTCYKFRTMKSDNEHKAHEEYVKKLIHGDNGGINNGSEKAPCFKIKNDPRITSIGKILRKTSFDELPQFVNVLKGEMSLVGPRPPVLYEVEEYKNWHYRRVLEVKPGITGLWQVMGRNRVAFDEMVRMDIRYAENWSILWDIKILFKTIFAVLKCDGK